MAQPTRDSFFILALLRELKSDEYKAIVLERKHTSRYADEQNYCLVPSDFDEAGGNI